MALKYRFFSAKTLQDLVGYIKAKVSPMIPTKVSQLENDSKYLTTHQSLADYVKTDDARLSDARNAKDVQAWAKAATKPSYNYSEIGSAPTKLSQFTNDKGYAAKSSTTVTVATTAWSNNAATLTVAGVTADNDVAVVPSTKADAKAWSEGGVWATAQAANSITLACDTAPTAALGLNVLILS